jgi:hypothetical protein
MDHDAGQSGDRNEPPDDGTPVARGTISLADVLVSLAILLSIFLVLSGAAARYAHAMAGAHDSAVELAEDRIEEVRAHPHYEELATRFRGVEFDVEGIPESYRRTGVVRRMDTLEVGVADRTEVTVEVYRPGLAEPLVRCIVVEAPDGG